MLSPLVSTSALAQEPIRQQVMSCVTGDADVCLELARHYRVDNPEFRDLFGDLAEGLYQRECDENGEANPCVTAVMLRFSRHPDLPLPESVMPVLEHACFHDNYVRACRDGGRVMDTEGFRFTHYFREGARDYYRRGCKLGDLEQCIDWSLVVPEAEQESILRSTCEAGHEPACVILRIDFSQEE